MNYYNPSVVVDDRDGPPPYARLVPVPGTRRTMLDWEIRAEGLERALLRVTAGYRPARLYVTENGSAWADTVGPDGQIHDPERTRYLEEHLTAPGEWPDLPDTGFLCAVWAGGNNVP